MNDMKFKARLKFPKMELKGTETKKEAAKIRGEFVSACQKATYGMQRDVGYWLNEAIEEATWSWPRATQRKNGSYVAPGLRNIVDTGNLKQSLKIATNFGKTQSSLVIKYTAPYAALVHYGGYIRPYGNQNAKAVYLPARPWISNTLMGAADEGSSDLFDFTGLFKERVSAQL